MIILYEDENYKLTCSETDFDKWVIFCPSAAGLPRITLNGIINSTEKKSTILENIYTPFGINEINFIAKNVNWYQHPNVSHCIELLKNIIKGNEENTIIYGSSMGGFGAIHFGIELGITSVAFSPQVTLDEKFDITEDWKKILDYIRYKYKSFKSNIIEKKQSLYPIYLFYDGSHILDRKHAIFIIKNYKNCISFNIPYSDHSCANVINETYGIKKIIISILNKEFNCKKFKKDFFNIYNIDEHRVFSAWSKFKFLFDIINEHNFYMRLSILRRKFYKDLCMEVCNIIEKYYPSKLDECLDCIANNKIILNHSCNIINFNKKYIYNSYDRIRICALFYQRKKNYYKAEPLYRQLYYINKSDVDIVGNLAFILAKQGSFEEATNLLFKNIELIGLNERNMLFLGKIYFLNKQFNVARKWIYLSFKYINFIQGNASIENFILYSRTLREEGRLKDAVLFLEKNLSKGCQSGNYLAHLGAYSVMLGKPEQGLEFLNLATQKKKYPSWVNIWINKAKSLI